MNRHRLFVASLVLNLGLLGVIVGQLVHSRRTPPAAVLRAPGSSSGAPAAAATHLSSPAELAPSSSSEPLPQAKAFEWAEVESPDYKTYMANLRAIGCPEQTIRDIILADVTKLYASRKAALHLLDQRPFQYWETVEHGRPTAEQAAEIARQEAALDVEKHNILAELLGSDDTQKEVSSQEDTARKLAFLPAATVEALAAVSQKYAGIEDQIKALADRSSGITNALEMQQIVARYQQKKAELARVLTPEQLEQYELSTSWTAENLRQAMVGFNPTADEFRTIFKLWRAQDEQLAVLHAQGQPDPGNDAVFDAIKQALGEDRFKAYRSKWWNFDYRDLVQFAQDYQLPAGAADQVYEMKQTALTQAQQVWANPSLTPEQRAAAAQALQAETEASVRAALGADGYQRYLQGNGNWLSRLGRR